MKLCNDDVNCRSFDHRPIDGTDMNCATSTKIASEVDEDFGSHATYSYYEKNCPGKILYSRATLN